MPPPLVQVSRDSQVTAIPGLSKDGHTHAPSWPSILGFPSNLAIQRLSRDGHTHTPPLGIPGYLDKGEACVWPSLDNPRMVKLLGNPGILGQGGGMCVAIPAWTIPGWLSYLGIPGYLDKGGHVCGHPWTILGLLSYLGIPGYLDKRTCV